MAFQKKPTSSGECLTNNPQIHKTKTEYSRFTEDPNRLLRIKDVLELVPCSKSAWWGWVKSGKAPAPIHLGDRCTCWRYSSILAFIKGGVAQ